MNETLGEIAPIITRQVRKWAEEEDLALEVMAISLPTKKIAERLGRTIRAVQGRYQVLGISPYNNDGRLTVRELSRLTGIPSSTLAEQVRMGKIPGEKVGAFWRIEWDGEDIRPAWNGRILYKQILEEESRSGRQTCYECEGPIRIGLVWCSQKCRGITTHNLFSEKLKANNK